MNILRGSLVESQNPAWDKFTVSANAYIRRRSALHVQVSKTVRLHLPAAGTYNLQKAEC